MCQAELKLEASNSAKKHGALLSEAAKTKIDLDALLGVTDLKQQIKTFCKL